MVPNEIKGKGQYFHIICINKKTHKLNRAKRFHMNGHVLRSHKKGKKSTKFGGLFAIKTMLNYLYSDARHTVKNPGSWVKCIQML